MVDTLSRVLIFFALIGLGALLSRTGKLDAKGLDGLSAYFYWLAFPAWLCLNFSRLPHPDSDTATTLGVYTCALAATALIVALCVMRLVKSRSEATAAGFATVVNNSSFLGIPIVLSLFGESARQIGLFAIAADFLILFCLGCVALAWGAGHTAREALIRTSKNPTFIGAALGVVMMALGLRFPPVLEQGMELLGNTASPAALVALGGMLGLMPARALVTFRPDTTVAIAGKILLAPALVALGLWPLMDALTLDPLVFKVCVFLAATPTAVSVFIQTRIYNVWYERAAVTVAQGTVFSLITLSLLALILH